MNKALSVTTLLLFSLPLCGQKVATNPNFPKEFENALNIIDDGKPLPIPKLIDGEAIVKGQIAGYDPSYKWEIEFQVNNPIINEEEDYVAEINDDGTFECKVPLVSTTTIYMYSRSLITHQLILSPKEETLIYFDLVREENNPGQQYVYFAGANAELNNQLYSPEYKKFKDEESNIHSILEDTIKGMTTIEYRDFLYNRERNVLESINKSGFTQKMKEYMQLCIKHNTYSWLSVGDFLFKIAASSAKSSNMEYEVPDFDKEYYAFIKETPFNDPKSLYYKSYNTSISSITVLDKLIYFTVFQPTSQMLDDLVRQDFFDSKYLDIVEHLRQNVFENIDHDRIEEMLKSNKASILALQKENLLKGKSRYLAKRILDVDKINSEKDYFSYRNLIVNFEDLVKIIDDIQDYYDRLGIKPIQTEVIPSSPDSEAPAFKEKSIQFYSSEEISSFLVFTFYKNDGESHLKKFKEESNLAEGLFCDLYRSQIAARRLGEMKPFTREHFKWLGELKDPFFLKYLTRRNDDLIAELARNANMPYNICQTSDAEGNQLLDEILKPHEGKVIFIDFWNTWCGPCISSMRKFATTKQGYKDKDVVFVYIADESSLETKWEKTVAEIGGEHYRLTELQMNSLKAKFGFSGIPSYAIYNQKGENIYFRTGFEGAKTLSEIINKGLEK